MLHVVSVFDCHECACKFDHKTGCRLRTYCHNPKLLTNGRSQEVDSPVVNYRLTTTNTQGLLSAGDRRNSLCPNMNSQSPVEIALCSQELFSVHKHSCMQRRKALSYCGTGSEARLPHQQQHQHAKIEEKANHYATPNSVSRIHISMCSRGLQPHNGLCACENLPS